MHSMAKVEKRETCTGWFVECEHGGEIWANQNNEIRSEVYRVSQRSKRSKEVACLKS